MSEEDPVQRGIDRAYIVWADEIRRRHQKEQAAHTINQLGEAMP